MNKQRAQLKILATTDLHAHVTNYDYYRDDVLADFGLMGLADVIQDIRANYPNTLLVDNGDFLQGNPIGNYLRDYSLENMHPMVRIMNELKYDVGTLGNHEFDFGIEFLEKMMNDIQYPIVNANIINGHNKPWIQPYVILDKAIILDSGEVKTMKIGVIGALPPQVTMWNHKIFADYAKDHEELYVEDIIETITSTIPKIKVEGADLIIVLAHSGFATRPYELGAENVIQFLAEIKDIDVIVAGHAHSTFPDDEYHFDLPIVMAGSFGQYLGVIDFDLEYCDQKWGIIQGSASLIENQQREQFQSLLFRLIEPAHELAKERMNAPIGENQTLFSSSLSLIQDDACTQLVADAQLWYAKQLLHELGQAEYSDLPLLSAVPAFKVGGRKNAPYDFTWIEKGVFTFKNVADLYPFNNQLALIKVTGKELKEWLECANSIYHQIHEHNEEQYLINWESHRGYNRDVIKGGLSYRVDARHPRRYNGDCMLINPDSERIFDLTYKGEPVLSDAEFMLATNQYRAYSGKFPGSGEAKVVALSSDEIPAIIELYLQNIVQGSGVVNVVAERNWSLFMGKANNVIYETSPTSQDFDYIIGNNPKVTFSGLYDAQKFALYKIRSYIL
ncbi:bifunctional 2',3'-cyclic-nucleotide 2'-phosphodiesterase/3'-nucleotidase [Wohlfahrtiimonas larvae]|uniref:2',3'-cyclic-nucleotide 2'-phosphodiesterase n=1 Tax=Wohlfahrtiimonas larvae TaxID=1157986 RepID=A0ABP9MJQ5_9GAMM|nr:bifunctional 2',3'-cyclic-nucleotide 2'-phosphodiesterase/3'-nucleotidase [Wohlfahrtiimonas larvae]